MEDLLILLFNGETDTVVLLDTLSDLFETLNFWRLHNIKGVQLTAKNILDFMIDQIINLIGEIRNKLIFKACYRFKIIRFTNPKPNITNDSSDSEDAPESAEQMSEPFIYKYSDKPEHYDDFI